MFEILGMAGITISMLAYVPQVVHLSKEHCSAGISRRAWAMWLVASLLVGTLAVHRGDFVFIALQLSTLTAAASSCSWRRGTTEWCAKRTQPTRRTSSRRLVDHVVPPSGDGRQDPRSLRRSQDDETRGRVQERVAAFSSPRLG